MILDKRYFGEYIPPERCACDCGTCWDDHHWDCAEETGVYFTRLLTKTTPCFSKLFLQVLQDAFKNNGYKLTFEQNRLSTIFLDATFEDETETQEVAIPTKNSSGLETFRLNCLFFLKDDNGFNQDNTEKAYEIRKKLFIFGSVDTKTGVLMLKISISKRIFKYNNQGKLYVHYDDAHDKNIFDNSIIFHPSSFKKLEEITKEVSKGKYLDLGDAFMKKFGTEPFGVKQAWLYDSKIISLADRLIDQIIGDSLNQTAPQFFNFNEK